MQPNNATNAKLEKEAKNFSGSSKMCGVLIPVNFLGDRFLE